ncbi:MAG: type II 3-dehydroquinate dehydratase [Gammaproteobacteria bacterium]|nr:type II 3-dehydroquinate dehydratase [Gammaproteobacteria bacterium]
MKILIINGPNMNMLGIREKDIYGSQTYDDLVKYISDFSKKENIEVEFFQSNHEGAIVDKIQETYFNKTDGIVINPAAYTHTSIAILDALKTVKLPTVEVHMSDLSKREDFRQVSYVSIIALKRIVGLGFDSYIEAIKFLKDYINEVKD